MSSVRNINKKLQSETETAPSKTRQPVTSQTSASQKSQKSLRDKVLTKTWEARTSSSDKAQKAMPAKEQHQQEEKLPTRPDGASSPTSAASAPPTLDTAHPPSSTPSAKYLAAVERLKNLPPKSDSALMTLRRQMRISKEAEVEAAMEAIKTTFEPESMDEGDSVAGESDSSLDSSTKTVNGNHMILNEFPKNASRILQHAKQELEKSGNLKREIRESVVESLQTLYEMVLRLSDSRALHMIEAQRARAEKAIIENKSQRKHVQAIESLMAEYNTLKDSIATMSESLGKELEATRAIIVRDVCEPISEMNKKTGTIHQNTTVISSSNQELSATLRDIKKRTSREPVDELIAKRDERLLAELQNIHHDIAQAEAAHNKTVPREEILDDVRAAIHEALLTTPMQCLHGATGSSDIMQPILSVTAENAQKLRQLEDETKGMRKDLHDRLQPVTERLEAVSSELRTMRQIQAIPSSAAKSLESELAAALAEKPKPPARPKIAYSEALKTPPPPKPNHTLIVSSTDPKNTGDNVIERIRDALDIKNTGARVERLRKAKNQKIILSCSTKEDLNLIKSRVQQDRNLKTEVARSKNPLVKIKDVLSYHSDAEIVEHLLAQNKHLTQGIDAKEIILRVRYRKRARNPHECHPVLELSPQLHKRFVEAGKIYIGLQRRPVEDHSPLVQCTKCLGFGHTKAICTEKCDLCSHCGDTHSWEKCPTRLAGKPPKCKNCFKAHGEEFDLAHNAFSGECREKQKWDTIARSRVSYC